MSDQNLRKALLGAWRLISCQQDMDGTSVKPFGDNPQGYLVYMPGGHGVGLSARIEDEAERARLKQHVEAFAPELAPEIPAIVADGRDVADDIVGRKAREAHPVGCAVAPQIGQRSGERMAATEFGVAVCADHQQPGRRNATEHVPQQ